MPRQFHMLSLEEFGKLLQLYRCTRKVDSVHLHHTWRPNHAQYNGERSMESLWIYHTRSNGWSDVPQHLTIATSGEIWTGRDWNTPPVSAKGHNGNRYAGPFMVTLVGDFDKGRDVLQGAQLGTLAGVIARLQDRFDLSPQSLRFHSSMTEKNSCPGDGLRYEEILHEVREAKSKLDAQRGAQGQDQWAAGAGSGIDPRLQQILNQWMCSGAGEGDGDAEPEEAVMTAQQQSIFSGVETPTSRARGGRGGDDKELTPEMLSELRPHVINLNQGRFSDSGIFRTSRAEVDAIFNDHLESALKVAQKNDKPLRLLFWGHGGLIPEKAGLWIAHLQVAWWKKNDVYPIHFVWETGFGDALKQILGGAREAAAARGLPRDVWDHTTDPAIEAMARTLGGVKIWGAMKESARLASEDGGGADYVAQKLAEFCGRHPGMVQLHAVGHSAGSIFHSHFLPRVFDKNVPPFETLSFLAPAVRVDEFNKRLLPYIGKEIKHLAMFTMKRDWEEDDNVAQVYRKSLLYLIYYALEPRRQEPILGLEISARSDGAVADLFGLKGIPSQRAEVIWSKTLIDTGRNASTSSSHGGFDNDRATMNSVLRRVVNHDDIVDFPEEAVERAIRSMWDEPVELPPEFRRLFASPQQPQQAQPAPPRPPQAGPGGAKRALCIGINKYPQAPLNGCVTDAENWGKYFQSRGYEVSYLLDEQATHDRILRTLESLVTSSRAGDLVLFQYAGHGTELPDVNGDEEAGEGTNGPMDEALCPYDYATGAFVIDDDIAEVFGKIPPGVAVTCFIDCCHSGTITRFMIGSAAPSAGTDQHARFLVATPEMAAKHQEFRRSRGSRAILRRGTPESMSQVVFSACLDSEVAYESNGNGEFTVRALQVLRSGFSGGSNEDFLNSVVTAFGPNARQHPELDCAPVKRKAAFVF